MKSLHKSQQVFILKGFVFHVLCAMLIDTAVIYFCNFFFRNRPGCGESPLLGFDDPDERPAKVLF